MGTSRSVERGGLGVFTIRDGDGRTEIGRWRYERAEEVDLEFGERIQRGRHMVMNI